MTGGGRVRGGRPGINRLNANLPCTELVRIQINAKGAIPMTGNTAGGKKNTTTLAGASKLRSRKREKHQSVQVNVCL